MTNTSGSPPRSPTAAFGPGQPDFRALFEAAQIVIPDAQHVVRVPVTPGEVVELPFGSETHFLARLGDGNLAIQVGDVTIILQGYAAAANDPQHPVVVESADGHPLDIALLLASTDPGLDIQTAAGPGAGDGGRGAGDTGAILQSFTSDAGLGGFEGAGVQGDSAGPSNAGGAVGGVPGIVNPPQDTAASTLPVDSGSHAPVAVDDAYTTHENTVLAIAAPGILVNDTDADGDPLKADILEILPEHGHVDVFEGGNFVYTPDHGFTGTDSFGYEATDGTDHSNIAKVTITVNPDTPPFAADDAYTTHENTVLTIAARGILVNDTDADGDPLKADILEILPEHGHVDVFEGGNFVYTPDHGFTGTDSFGYEATDGTDHSNIAKVTITVNPDTPPFAADDAYTTHENTVLAIAAPGILVNDTDADGDPLKADILEILPEHGHVDVFEGGNFVYTPDRGFTGTDSFGYEATDGTDHSNIAKVTITVNPDTPPFAADDAYTTHENTVLTIAARGILVNDTDADGDPLKADILEILPEHGHVDVFEGGNFVYTPDHGFTGTDSFGYEATDGTHHSNIAKVTITVNPDTPPVAVDDAYTAYQGRTLTIAAPGVLGNDTDAEGDRLVVSLTSLPAHGTFASLQDGSFTYTPDAGFSGTDHFVYKASDGPAESTFATVTINVVPDAQPLLVNAALATEHATQIPEITGTSAHETLIGSSDDSRLDGGGGNDLIFGGSGDETIIFHDGDTVKGGGDSATGQDLVDGTSRGDVLTVDFDFNLADAAHDDAFQGIETISAVGSGGQMLTLDATAVQHMSDHLLDPSGVFGSAAVIKFDGDVLDQLYLSTTRDGGTWVETGTTTDGGAIYAHEATAGDVATANAYVVVAHAALDNVHANQHAQ